MVVALQRPGAEVAGLRELPVQAPGILVVDDEEPIRRLLQMVLQRQGFTVWLAADGGQALKLYERYRSQIALVLLDVCMPRLDGFETLAALRKLSPDLPCCFLTGHAGNYSERQLRQQGAARVFAKPFALPELATALWNLVVQSGTQPAEHCGSTASFVRECHHALPSAQ